mgnify:FL=1
MANLVFGRPGFQTLDRAKNTIKGVMSGHSLTSQIRQAASTPGGLFGQGREETQTGGYSQDIPASFDQGGSSQQSQGGSNPSLGGGSWRSARSSSANASRSQSALDKLRNLELAQINDAYGTEKKRLGKLESLTNKQYSGARGRLEAYRPQLETEKSTQVAGIDNEQAARELEARSAMQQVRQLLADQQRKAQAYNSATGNVSSSVAGAQGELFSRQANSSLSNVQNQRQTAMGEINNKRRQIDDFFTRKNLELNDQLAELEQRHLAQLDEISNARSASRAAKNKATAQAWQNYVSQRVNLENSMMNNSAQWNALSQQYGGSYDGELENFVNSMDGTDQITSGDQLSDVPTIDDSANGSVALRSTRFFNDQEDPLYNNVALNGDNTDLIRLLQQQNALA